MESKHNRNLDILRGIAALVVVGFHLISCYPRAFDKNYELGPVVNYNFPGHMSVLVFFILSGYVISINTKRLTDRKSIKGYIRKRLTRIVPIYLLAMGFTIAITWGSYDWHVILSNLTFTSVPFDNVIIEDGPLWSLNYELIYYFVFIFFSFYNISMVKTVKVLAVTVALFFIFFHNVAVYPLVLSYLIGFLFWATGAMIAEIKTFPRWEISSSRIIAVFILMFCLQPFNPYGPVLKVLHLPMADYSAYSWYQKSISWTDLYYYPLTIILILSLTHAYTKYHRYVIWFIYTSAIFRMAMIFKVYNLDFIIKEHYVVPGVILLGSLALWVSDFNVNARLKNVFNSASRLGGISYGVYMVHMPIMYFFGRTAASSWTMFLLKLLCYAVTLLFVSWLLEEKFQMWVKRMLRKVLDRNTAPAVIKE